MRFLATPRHRGRRLRNPWRAVLCLARALSELDSSTSRKLLAAPFGPSAMGFLAAPQRLGCRRRHPPRRLAPPEPRSAQEGSAAPSPPDMGATPPHKSRTTRPPARRAYGSERGRPSNPTQQRPSRKMVVLVRSPRPLPARRPTRRRVGSTSQRLRRPHPPRHQQKKKPGALFPRHRAQLWQRPTLAQPIDALPSALQRFTSVFGMGTGGATARDHQTMETRLPRIARCLAASC
jgi:hypothetical protein